MTAVLIAIAITATTVILVNKKPIVEQIYTPIPEQQTQQPVPTPGDTAQEEQKPTTSSTEFIMPVKNATVSCGYAFCFNATLKQYSLHTGLDFSAPQGTPVLAVLDGTVTAIESGDVFYGTTITLTHANGLVTTYSYLQADQTLAVGDTVKQGQAIGLIAEAEGAENKLGTHLHFTVQKDGKPQDPEAYLDIDLK